MGGFSGGLSSTSDAGGESRGAARDWRRAAAARPSTMSLNSVCMTSWATTSTDALLDWRLNVENRRDDAVENLREAMDVRRPGGAAGRSSSETALRKLPP